MDFLPKIWGQSQLFAFSGFSGETDWFNPFVGQLLGETPGVLLHAAVDSSKDFEIRFGGETAGSVHEGKVENLHPFIIGPDVLDLEIDFGREEKARFRLVWFDRMTLLGEARGERVIPCLLTNGVFTRLSEDEGNGPAIVGSGIVSGHIDGMNVVKLQTEEEVAKFAVVRGPEVRRMAKVGLQSDFESIFSDRMKFYEDLSLPRTDDKEVLRTFVKACAVMKVNIETPCGEIMNRWSTPDKWPHRYMWLWDSAFNSLGVQHLDPELGMDCIRAVLTKQKLDGFIPHTMAPDPKHDSNMTQPPVLAWAAWELYSLNPNRDFLREVYPKLKKYLEWDLSHMDRMQTGLLQWQFSGPDSGMDNSPRFDDGPDFDAVDLNCFVANECQVLELMARELRLANEAKHWMRLGRWLSQKINDHLWHEEDGFYYDRRKDRSWIRIKTVDDFLPLFAGVASKERAAILVENHLTCPVEFWPAFPVPSVALNESKFELDMWRGPTWINYNWLVICGLRRYGYQEHASKLIAVTMKEISKWRRRRGSIYEFYDPLGRKAPQDLRRKGKVRSWRDDGIPVIAEYFWSAAMFVHMATDRPLSQRDTPTSQGLESGS